MFHYTFFSSICIKKKINLLPYKYFYFFQLCKKESTEIYNRNIKKNKFKKNIYLLIKQNVYRLMNEIVLVRNKPLFPFPAKKSSLLASNTGATTRNERENINKWENIRH